MNHSNRLLELEPIEERALPSTMFLSFEPRFSNYERVSHSSHSEGQFRTYTANPVFMDAHGRTFTLENVIIRFQRGHEPQVIRLFSAWTSPATNNNTPTTPQPEPVDSSSAQETATQSESRVSSSATQARSANRARSAPEGWNGVELQPVSIAVPSDAATVRAQTVENPQADQSPRATERVSVAGTAPATFSRTNYPILAGANEDLAVDGMPAPAMPESAEPPVAPLDGVLPEDVAAIVASIQAAHPIAGVLAFDVAALGTASTGFLERISELTPDWPDGMPEFEDYLWTAAAVLLAGGAIRAASGRRAERMPHGPSGLDSALAEWEGKHARRLG